MPTYIEQEMYRNSLTNLESRCQDPIKPGLKQALEMLDDMPVDDVEIVTRCKNCYMSVVIGEVMHCTYWNKDTDENGFCHEGG